MRHKIKKISAAGGPSRPRGASGTVIAAWTAIGLGLAYWIWPDQILEKPLAESRLGTVLQAAAALVVALASVAIAISAWLDA